MNFREWLLQLAATYDATSRTGGEGQTLISQAPELLAEIPPPGILIRGSHPIGQATHTPWLGFFNPDETVDPKQGLYACWLFDPTLTKVTLSIQQGSERLRSDGLGNPRGRLIADAAALRDRLGDARLAGLTGPFDLGPGNRQRLYVAGSVAHKTYELPDLPGEAVLRDDLAFFLGLLEELVSIRRDLLLKQPGALSQGVPPAALGSDSDDPLLHFKPKNADEYLARLKAVVQKKSRRHEELVNAYAKWAASRDWQVSSPHPIDLLLQSKPSAATHALIEAKWIRRGNATAAVREAIGQLFTYRHLVVAVENRPTTQLVGLFSEPIGDCWVELLTQLGICSVWRADGAWQCGPSADGLNLADQVVALSL